MRHTPFLRRLSLSAACALLSTLFLACGAGAQSQSNTAAMRSQQNQQPDAPRAEPTPRPDGVRLVTVEELKRLVAEDGAVALDVRGSVEFEMGHIRGARHMPLGLVASRASELPKGKLIVPYCACSAEQLSVRAVLELKKQGVENTAALVGGWDAWVKAGLPVEGTNDIMPTQVESRSENQSATGGAAGGQRGGRVAPPAGLKCGLDNLTLYDGLVVAYERKRGSTFLRIDTNFDTTEEVTLKHPGTDDPSSLFLINGEAFGAADWQKVEGAKHKLRPGMRANVWVCVGDPAVQPVVDWRPDDTGANPRSR